jgi:hypothetical protein
LPRLSRVRRSSQADWHEVAILALGHHQLNDAAALHRTAVLRLLGDAEVTLKP